MWAWARRRAPVGRPGSPGDANRRHQSPPNRACPPPAHTHTHTHLLPQAYIIALGEPTGREPGAARAWRSCLKKIKTFCMLLLLSSH